jgi:hypothetical protein
MESVAKKNSDAWAMSLNVQSATAVPKGAIRRDGVATLIQCDGFRCMAYLDRKGIWRGFFSDQELKGKIEIVDLATKQSVQSGAYWEI